MINWRQSTLSQVAGTFVILVMLGGMMKCGQLAYHIANDKDAIREANGGVIPGKEAIDRKGRTYPVRILTFNNQEYVCFFVNKGMACVKE
jgi:hypothetical protein